ncbi:hypothetical protein [Pragia fontium]|uniref:hypothetical protein n=1 Tax=Pragia fontium TaxID=82985 RepID=UPI00064A616E|nr:hypothetical protein [Pragia fontium]AKJ41394.1 hypothetical protein QQ39_04310 [Pragia fontium]
MSLLRVIIKGLVLVSGLVAISLSLVNIASANSPKVQDSEILKDMDLESQLGFYDLLSKKEEVYDVRLYPGMQDILVNVTTPKNSRLIIKGRMVLDTQVSGNNSFKFSTIYYYNPMPDQLIDSVMDSSKREPLLINSYATETDQLIVTQNGLLFIHPKGSNILQVLAPKPLAAPASNKNG